MGYELGQWNFIKDKVIIINLLLHHFQLQPPHDNPYYMYGYHMSAVFHIYVHKNMAAILHRENVRSRKYTNSYIISILNHQE